MTTPDTHPAFPPLTPDLIGFFRARAKGTGGMFDPALFAAALPWLPGWSIQSIEGEQKVNEIRRDEFGAVLRAWSIAKKLAKKGQRRHSFLVGSDYNDKTRWFVPRELLDDADAPRVRVCAATVKAAPGEICALENVPGVWGEGGHTAVYWLKSPRYGLRGWRITAPDGSFWDVFDRPSESKDGINGGTFWKGAYYHGLQELAQAALPTDAAQARVKAAREAQKKGMGLCGICFGAFAVHARGDLVQHGYQMNTQSGQGHWGAFKASSDCFGRGHVPWAVSSKPTQLYVDQVVRPTLESQSEYLADLRAGTVFTLRAEIKKAWRDDKGKDHPAEYGDVGPSDPRWPLLLKHAIEKMQLRVEDSRRTLAFYENAIKNWPAVP